MAAGRAGFRTKNLTAGEFLLNAPVVLPPLAFGCAEGPCPLLATDGLLVAK